jgi:hypothetical protein
MLRNNEKLYNFFCREKEASEAFSEFDVTVGDELIPVCHYC